MLLWIEILLFKGIGVSCESTEELNFKDASQICQEFLGCLICLFSFGSPVSWGCYESFENDVMGSQICSRSHFQRP